MKDTIECVYCTMCRYRRQCEGITCTQKDCTKCTESTMCFREDEDLTPKVTACCQRAEARSRSASHQITIWCSCGIGGASRACATVRGYAATKYLFGAAPGSREGRLHGRSGAARLHCSACSAHRSTLNHNSSRRSAAAAAPLHSLRAAAQCSRTACAAHSQLRAAHRLRSSWLLSAAQQ